MAHELLAVGAGVVVAHLHDASPGARAGDDGAVARGVAAVFFETSERSGEFEH